MYAIIRAGGKQSKVREGDIIDVERVQGDGEVTFTPVLFVDAKGTIVSGREELRNAKVTARVVGESAGDKVEMFKYKAKTGYRRRGGHRQKYTTLEVLKIEGPKKTAAKKADEGTAAEEAPAEVTPAPAKTAAPRAAAKKTTATGAAAKKSPAPAKKTPAKGKEG